MPAPFLGVAVLGDGGLTAAVDGYGDVVDLRVGPAGRPLVEISAARQAAGTVAGDSGIQPWARVGGRKLPIWRADRIRQRYLPGSNVLRTVAWFGGTRVKVSEAVHGGKLAIVSGGEAPVELRMNAGGRFVSRSPRLLAAAAASDRRWLGLSRPLGEGAPGWADRMYRRSLLVLRALRDGRSGAVAAGARDGWAYVWPRDAATAAIAFAAAGYLREANRVTRFLLGLDLDAAARFHGDGSPVAGRPAQGDAAGWVAAAVGAVGSAQYGVPALTATDALSWRDRSDYREGDPGDLLANAIASGEPEARIGEEFGFEGGLGREPGQPRAFDAAAAWAVRPFPRPALAGAVRRTLLRLQAGSTRFGLLPGEDWAGGDDPWTAPTAWSAWSLAALGERQRALSLLAELRRAATPASALPERVDAHTGTPRSTTPLAWSHAFAVLALQELWPGKR